MVILEPMPPPGDDSPLYMNKVATWHTSSPQLLLSTGKTPPKNSPLDIRMLIRDSLYWNFAVTKRKT